MDSQQVSDQHRLFHSSEPLLIRSLRLGEQRSSIYFSRSDEPDILAELKLEHHYFGLSKNWGDVELSLPLPLEGVIIAPQPGDLAYITLSSGFTQVRFYASILFSNPRPVDLPSTFLDQIVIAADDGQVVEQIHKNSYQNLLAACLRDPGAEDGSGSLRAPAINRIAETLLTLRKLHLSNGVYEEFDDHFQEVLGLIATLCDNYLGYDISREELYRELYDLHELLV